MGYLIILSATDIYFSKNLPTMKKIYGMGDVVVVRLSDNRMFDTANGGDISDESYWEEMNNIDL